MNTRDAAEKLRSAGLKQYTPDEVAKLASLRVFPNAQKDSRGIWEIPNGDIEQLIKQRRLGRRKHFTSWGLVLGVITLIGVIFGGIQAYNSFRAIPIPLAPNVKSLSTDQVLQITDPTTKPRMVICRNRIRVANNGDAATSIVAVDMIVHLLSEDLNIHAEDFGMLSVGKDHTVLVNVWGANPPPEEEYVGVDTIAKADLVTGSRLPTPVEKHSTADIYVDTIVLFTQNTWHNVSVDYTLDFQDVAAVPSPTGSCF